MKTMLAALLLGVTACSGGVNRVACQGAVNCCVGDDGHCDGGKTCLGPSALPDGGTLFTVLASAAGPGFCGDPLGAVCQTNADCVGLRCRAPDAGAADGGEGTTSTCQR